LENRHNRTAFWDAAPGKVKGQKTLSQILPSSDAVFLCLPSSGMRLACSAIKLYLPKKAVVVCLAKGVEEKTHLTMDRLLARVLPFRQSFALLFGPMLASELSMEACGHADCAGSIRARETVAEIFSGTRLSVSPSSDLRGVALCGALKNIYAIGLGIISALGSGDNVRGAYVAAATKEMGEIVKLLGGRRETVLGFSGLADLVATGVNETSRNRQVGCALVVGDKCHGTEGERAAASIAALLRGKHKKFIVFNALHRVLSSGASPVEIPIAVCASK
jgi:glycerol-3-phosphate dehydrogenase (NAD(P)+)